MHAQPVDPRDVKREYDRPTYRVHFWEATKSSSEDGVSWASDEWRVTGARDVVEVFDWAATQARGRRVELLVEVGPSADLGVIRLAGIDPGGLHVRRAGPEEVDDLAELWIRARRAAVPSVPPPVHPDDEVDGWFRDVVLPQQEVWVADADGMVGLLVLDNGWVDQLYVEPRLTGWRIGTLLLGVAKSRFPAGLELWTFESNAGARRFYEREGFRAAGGTIGDNEEGSPDVLYCWPGR